MSNKILSLHFGTLQADFKVYMIMQITWNGLDSMFKMDKSDKLTTSNFKMHYEATVIKTVE